MQEHKGNLAIHEIMVEEHLVNYWENFGFIAFDSLQKAILTRCSLKTSYAESQSSVIYCCFSFTIRRDNHNMYVSFVQK